MLETDFEEMMNCLIVISVVGGLGNQLYILSLSLMRAQQFNTSLVWPIGMGMSPGYANSPTYWDTFLKRAVSEYTVDRAQCAPVVRTIDHGALVPWPSTESLDFDQKGSILMSGMYTTMNEMLPHRAYLRNVFKNEQNETHFRNLYPGRNLVIAYRSFFEEQRPEWAPPFRYYQMALPRILQSNHTVHIFGESGGIQEFSARIRALLPQYQGDRLVIWPGLRDRTTTTLHMSYMMAADDFLLTRSTFHVWGALLTACPDSVVVHDGRGGFSNTKGWAQIDANE